MKVISFVAGVVAVLFMGLTAGAAIFYFEVFPHNFYRGAFLALDTVLRSDERADDIGTQFTGAKPPSPYDRSTAPLRDNRTGVGRYAPELAYTGYTVYASGYGEPVIRLINMQGETKHTWHIDTEILAATERQDGKDITVRGLQATPFLQPNGDMYLVLTVRGPTPWGYGLSKIDKDSNILWSFTEQVHHDMDFDADGRIYTLGHFIEQDPRPGLERIETPFIDDSVIILSPEGDKLDEFSVLDAIRDSEYQAILRYADPTTYNGDILHTNSIQVLDETTAASVPFAEAGQLLLSLRNLSSVVLIDPQSRKVVWAKRGYWLLQHDPEFLTNGNILLFDNLGDLANPGGSRVIEFDPVTMAIAWEYPGNTGDLLYSAVKSSQQRLANGNTLITETNNGRLLEVTPDSQVAWEYFIPEQVERRDDIVKKAIEAERFAADELDFEFNGD